MKNVFFWLAHILKRDALLIGVQLHDIPPTLHHHLQRLLQCGTANLMKLYYKQYSRKSINWCHPMQANSLFSSPTMSSTLQISADWLHHKNPTCNSNSSQSPNLGT
ncbi:hypothetical protein ACOSQ4_019737 [Xanthoceras sorbifolium]